MDLLKVDSLDVATQKLYNEICSAGTFVTVETIKVCESFGRVIAEDIVSKIAVPSFDRSTVDGFAVISKDTQGASEMAPTFLDVIGESKMGEECTLSIKSGECVYVPTGGMLPTGANACIMVEHTENLTDKKISVYDSVAEGQSVVKVGDDIKEGTSVVSRGKIISAADMGFLSSVGIDEVKVYKRIKITIISTGDELVDNNDNLSSGKLRDVNTNLLIGLCNEHNIEVVDKFLLADDKELLERTIKDAMNKSDVVVISGGSSKGKKDATAEIIGKVASSGVLTHGIAIKPGKPTITGFDRKSNTVFVGLPGHPVAAAVLFKLLVVGVIEKLMHCNNRIKTCMGKMTENIKASPGRMTFQLVSIDDDFNVHLVLGRSGLIHTLSIAKGYIILDKDNEGINKGENVLVYYL